MTKFLILLILVFAPILICISQEISIIKTIPFSKIVNISSDLKGAFYIADHQGNVVQFDSTGKELTRYSPQQPASITLLEARKTMNVFIFYRDFQQYLILNRFLAPSPVIKFDEETVGYAYMAAPSSDNNVWIFDNSRFSLKKFDYNLRTASIDVPLELILDANHYDINLIKEYQNKVFLNNSNQQILVFDNLGNYNLTLHYKTRSFSFYKDEIYFIENNEIVFYNLYTLKERKINLKNLEGILFAIAEDYKIILFKENEILLCSLKNERLKK